MAYMQQRHFKQMWRRDVHVPTRTFLLPLFCISISYLSHSTCLAEILKFYTIPMFKQAVTNFVNQKAFSSKHVSTFFTAKVWRRFLITSQLRLGPFLRGAAQLDLQLEELRKLEWKIQWGETRCPGRLTVSCWHVPQVKCNNSTENFKIGYLFRCTYKCTYTGCPMIYDTITKCNNFTYIL